MIGIGLKLAFSGRGAWLARGITTLAVAVGAALFLFALCVVPAMEARADRTAWFSAVGNASGPWATQDASKLTTIISATVDRVGESDVDVVIVAGSSRGAPVPPGIPRMPAVDEVFVSPAAQRLIDEQPLVGRRYGLVVGGIADSALAGPDHALIIRGVPLPCQASG